MQPDRFDAAIRSIAPLNRRRVGGWLVGGGLAAAAALEGRSVDARSTGAGCRQPRNPCARGDQCCSGVCRRKRCRTAPNQGTCTIRQNQCVDPYPASACNGPAGCACLVTTAGASFCGAGGICAACQTDADCARIGQPGAACVHSEGDHCCGGDAGTACIQPCSNPAP